MKRKIVVFENHRNIKDIIVCNRNDYFLINSIWINRLARFIARTSYKNKEKVFHFIATLILRIIHPHLIIACNWLSPIQKSFYLYSRNRDSKYIVVQHGAYVGGLIRNDHKFLKCDKFLIWGPYFKEKFDEYNSNRTNDIIVFGNPLYNSRNRVKFSYSKNIRSVLIAFSVIGKDSFTTYRSLIQHVQKKYDSVAVKYHILQKEKIDLPEIEEIKGGFSEIVHNFDLIVVDHSTALLDAVFFKKQVIYINYYKYNNLYEKYLGNQLNHIMTDPNYNLNINTNKQEELLNLMVTRSSNKLRY